MEVIVVDKLKMHSLNKVEDNITKIAKLFPNVITETIKDGEVTRAIDFDVLRQELSDTIVEGPQERIRPFVLVV
jgi:adenine-specific DNA-methyltransferase